MENKRIRSTDERTIWQKNRGKLTAYSFNETWELVIHLFEKRVQSKFVEPLNLLIRCGNNEGSGFSIVAIECLLVELFATFRKGKIYNNRYCEKNDPPYQYKDCQQVYADFLTEVPPFNNQFTKPTQTQTNVNLFSAEEFYIDVRCGLLHEGRTKNNWTINLKPKNEKAGDFLAKEGNKLKIYRTVFLKKLEEYLEMYLSELRSDGQEGNLIRRNFARKMDNLYGFKPNAKKYEWWRY